MSMKLLMSSLPIFMSSPSVIITSTQVVNVPDFRNTLYRDYITCIYYHEKQQKSGIYFSLRQ